MPSYTVDIFSLVAGILLGIIIFMACVGIVSLTKNA
jgi:hypothetical protein